MDNICIIDRIYNVYKKTSGPVEIIVFLVFGIFLLVNEIKKLIQNQK